MFVVEAGRFDMCLLWNTQISRVKMETLLVTDRDSEASTSPTSSCF